MPQGYLTGARRQEAALQSACQKTAEGLAAVQNRERWNNGHLGDGLGMNRKSAAKPLRTEALQADIVTPLKVIRLAGMEVNAHDL